MSKNIRLLQRLCCTLLVAAGLVLAGSGAVLADRKGHSRDDYPGYRYDRGPRGRDDGHRYQRREVYREHHGNRRGEPHISYRGRTVVVPGNRVRWYRDVVVVRPYGHWYPGYAHYHHDDDAWKWLAFTAITLGVLDYLNEAQQRQHEAAQVSAATAPIGERIIWQEGGASGSVTAVREGSTTSGRYCREFQHEVTVGGRTEQAYGTACRNPDGSWQVVSSSSR